MSSEESSMLNVFEIFDELSGKRHNLVCFIDPMRAGVEGINPRTIIGEIPTDVTSIPDGFDPDHFVLNPGFAESVTQFLNEFARGPGSEALQIQARSISTGWLYVIDPRFTESDVEPGPENIIGAYPIDDTGQIVPNAFLYNEKHRLFDNEFGLSGLLQNREFFDWLNPPAEEFENI